MKNYVLIFDLDDTLISEKEYIKSGFKTVSNYFAKQYTLDEKKVNNIICKLFEENTKNVFNRLYENYKIEYNEKDIRRLVNLYREHTPNITLLKDAEELLNVLMKNNIKVGVITDGYKETQRKKIEVLNLNEVVEKIIITDELGREFWKPNKKSFEMMREYFKTDYKNMIYIGDNILKDFISPNQLGMLSIQICRDNGVYKNIKECKEEAMPKIKIKSLLEILEILNI